MVSSGLVIRRRAMWRRGWGGGGGVGSAQAPLSHQSHEAQEGFWRGGRETGTATRCGKKKAGNRGGVGIAAVAWAPFPTESTEIFQRFFFFFFFLLPLFFPDTVLLFCTDARLALPWQRLGEGVFMLRH